VNWDKRRKHGVHYTTEPHVLRVLHPLFLEDLETALQTATDARAVHAFLDHLVSLSFLDPACGTGNFLVVAYRQLRQLETRALKKLVGLGMSVAQVAARDRRVELHRLHGIEIDSAAVEVARAALEQAHREEDALAAEVSPLALTMSEPRLVVANALRIDWNDVLSADRASFVFGKPPFVGMAWMTLEQQQERQRAFAFTDTRGLRIGRLDYAASWLGKSISYGMGKRIRFAYVLTNSISQGEHPRSLGPILLRHGYHVDFAHRTFPWRSNELRRANVHVVIVGFSQVEGIPKRLFEVGQDDRSARAKSAKNINLYLTDGPDVFPAKRSGPFRSGYPIATKGSQPTDGGHLIIEPGDLEAVLVDPIAAPYVRRYVQATEFLWDVPRYCLWLANATAAEIEASPILRARTARVRLARQNSRTAKVREHAETPALFTQMRQPKERYLALPEVSSEKRKWIPAAFLDPSVIAGNKLITLPSADLWIFGILQSSMFMAWVRAMAGRMKSDISISPDLTYCTFPFPEADALGRDRVVEAAQVVLRTRKVFAGKSLGELYDPRQMPKELEAAHAALDEGVDALFAEGRAFGGDGERLEVLLERYETESARGKR
jgi:hypothetical protein